MRLNWLHNHTPIDVDIIKAVAHAIIGENTPILRTRNIDCHMHYDLVHLYCISWLLWIYSEQIKGISNHRICVKSNNVPWIYNQHDWNYFYGRQCVHAAVWRVYWALHTGRWDGAVRVMEIRFHRAHPKIAIIFLEHHRAIVIDVRSLADPFTRSH